MLLKLVEWKETTYRSPTGQRTVQTYKNSLYNSVHRKLSFRNDFRQGHETVQFTGILKRFVFNRDIRPKKTSITLREDKKFTSRMIDSQGVSFRIVALFYFFIFIISVYTLFSPWYHFCKIKFITNDFDYTF